MASDSTGAVSVSGNKFRDTSQAYKGMDAFSNTSITSGGDSSSLTPFRVSISEKGMGSLETTKRLEDLGRQMNQINVLKSEFGVAKGMYELNTLAEQLETAAYDNVVAFNERKIRFNGMQASFLDVEVSNHELGIKRLEAPLLKATANYRAEQTYEMMLGTYTGLVKTQTDRKMAQWALTQNGYDLAAMPSLPESMALPMKVPELQLPEFKRPDMSFQDRKAS